MNKQRTKIPDELAAQALFLSDRTCCVCRDPARKVEIHHIDNDPSNNQIGNLAVICKDCHSDAHTNQAFARNLTPLLILKYRDSWLEIVRVRLNPGGADGELLEYALQILLELSLEPHRWANRYLALSPTTFADEARGLDRWTYLGRVIGHTYSDDEWQHYKSLFDSTSPQIANNLEHLLSTYVDAVSPRVKLQVFRTASALRNGRLAYLAMPKIIQSDPEHGDLYFTSCFKNDLASLGRLADLADAERKLLASD